MSGPTKRTEPNAERTPDPALGRALAGQLDPLFSSLASTFSQRCGKPLDTSLQHARWANASNFEPAAHHAALGSERNAEDLTVLSWDLAAARTLAATLLDVQPAHGSLTLTVLEAATLDRLWLESLPGADSPLTRRFVASWQSEQRLPFRSQELLAEAVFSVLVDGDIVGCLSATLPGSLVTRWGIGGAGPQTTDVLPVTTDRHWTLRLGEVVMTASEFDALQAGDICVLSEETRAFSAAQLLAGNTRLAVSVEPTQQGLRLRSREAVVSLDQVGQLDEQLTRLRVEYAGIPLSGSDIAALRGGGRLEIDVPGDGVVAVYRGNRQTGRGALVRTRHGLGVRLLELES